ncbi:CDK-activating kinase assembly factor MAT1-domain-containing protein, partial [Lineolata rhizophorae]
EICPVCKSSRYLNPNMRFLVNPECYHKMCESCVDRIFSGGPANCPIAGCRRTLRKNRFRNQTFGDIQIEREVDIRRRINDIFNRREDEFDTLLDYNNYLNEVEDLTFNLINNIDVEATERRIAGYKAENKAAIARNKVLASDDASSFESRQQAKREQARLRREADLRDEAAERRARDDARRGVINRLANADVDDPARVVQDASKKVLPKKSDGRKRAGGAPAPSAEVAGAMETLGANGSADASGGGGSGFNFLKNLKKQAEPEPEKPFDPLEGFSDMPDYYVLLDDYDWDWLDDVKKEKRFVVGGYDVHEYYSHAMCDAFAGLGVMVEDEMVGKEIAMPSAAAAST